MANSSAHPIEGEVIIVEQGIQDGFIEDNMNLVAKVISDKELTFKTIKVALMGFWGYPNGVSIVDVGVNKSSAKLYEHGNSCKSRVEARRSSRSGRPPKKQNPAKKLFESQGIAGHRLITTNWLLAGTNEGE
ncbi:hypothetical protein PIB30_086269 [Stylosanthes scabra]|uniref:Uncharacterized protein n=1 Tax=Stylosanthes scabra TaxID=79078 RepID=A0ABU6YQR7_9FABA|nr:hypothetical protein [Stylosanthes scabra]